MMGKIEMKIEQTLCRNWDCTTGVMHSRKHSRFDCIDPLSKIMISRRKRERERGFLGSLSQPRKQRKPKEQRKSREREREREREEGRNCRKIFFSLSFREKVERKEMKSVYRTSIF